ncbi:hypothetical protein [Cognatiluteimonas telluris]|uniref:hypothetical protein n=1 Tax=Cognatiluteimonas telluris TaxID=1104775 RepID=UPI00140CD6DF|nr:hypothetical protein [Lysobacter telluris]
MKRKIASPALLLEVLEQISPSDEATSEALDRIQDAIETYLSHKPHLDENGTRHAGSISHTRKALADLEKSIGKALNAVKEMPLEAIPFFCRAYKFPRGRFSEQLRIAREAAAEAHKLARTMPNKTGDIPRQLLAYDVALVFVEVLGKQPTSTRERDGQTNHPRGGAAYARVLNETFVLAGIEKFDLGLDIDEGIRLLRAGPY